MRAIPAIAQDHETKEVLMMAWMNQEAVEKTLKEGALPIGHGPVRRSGSRAKHRATQEWLNSAMIAMRMPFGLVNQTGAALHTNRRHCFYRAVQDGAVVELIQPMD